jgi:hypothetical protein
MNPGPPARAGGKDTNIFNPHSNRQMSDGKMNSFAETLARNSRMRSDRVREPSPQKEESRVSSVSSGSQLDRSCAR